MPGPTSADLRAWQRDHPAQANDPFAWRAYAGARWGTARIDTSAILASATGGTTTGGTAAPRAGAPTLANTIHMPRPVSFYDTMMDSDNASAGRGPGGIGPDWIGGQGNPDYFWTPAAGQLHVDMARAEALRDGQGGYVNDQVWQQGYQAMINDPRWRAAVAIIDQLYGLQFGNPNDPVNGRNLTPGYNNPNLASKYGPGRVDARNDDPAYRVAEFLKWGGKRGSLQVEPNAGQPGQFYNPWKVQDPIEYMYLMGFWQRPTDPNDYYSRPHPVYSGAGAPTTGGQGIHDDRYRGYLVQTGVNQLPEWHEDMRTPAVTTTPAGQSAVESSAGTRNATTIGKVAAQSTQAPTFVGNTAGPAASMGVGQRVAGTRTSQDAGTAQVLSDTGGAWPVFVDGSPMPSDWTWNDDGTVTTPTGMIMDVDENGVVVANSGRPPGQAAPAAPAAPAAGATRTSANGTNMTSEDWANYISAEYALQKLRLDKYELDNLKIPIAQQQIQLAWAEFGLKQQMNAFEREKFEVEKQNLEKEWGFKFAQLKLQTGVATGMIGDPWSDDQIAGLYSNVMQAAISSGQYQRPTRDQWVTWVRANGVSADQAEELADAVYNFARLNERGPDQAEFTQLAKSINLGVTPTLESKIQQGYLDVARQAEARAERQRQDQRAQTLSQLYANPRNYNQFLYYNELSPAQAGGGTRDIIRSMGRQTTPGSTTGGTTPPAQPPATPPAQPPATTPTPPAQPANSTAGQLYDYIMGRYGQSGIQGRPSMEQWAQWAEDWGAQTGQISRSQARSLALGWYQYVGQNPGQTGRDAFSSFYGSATTTPPATPATTTAAAESTASTGLPFGTVQPSAAERKPLPATGSPSQVRGTALPFSTSQRPDERFSTAAFTGVI